MSLEQQLEKFGASMDRLSAALEKAGIAGAATAPTKEVKKDKANGKAPDLAAVKAVAEKLRELTDKTTVQALLKKVGKVGATTQLDEKHYAKFIAEATAAIKAKEAEDEDEDEEEEEDEDDDE